MNRLTLCRILGIIFLLSGIAKAFNIGSFAYEVRMYADAYLWDGLAYWATPIAVLVCAVEIFFGLMAMRRDYSRVCSVIFFILLTFFTWLTAINYFAPTLFGSIESCGCFGELIHFSPLASFIKSAVMWMGALVLIFKYTRDLHNWEFHKLMYDRYAIISVVVSLSLPIFSELVFNKIGHIPYICIFVAMVCGTTYLLYTTYHHFQINK